MQDRLAERPADHRHQDPAQHRCLPCLAGPDPDKRACALRHLAAAGLLAPGPQVTRDRPAN